MSFLPNHWESCRLSDISLMRLSGGSASACSLCCSFCDSGYQPYNFFLLIISGHKYESMYLNMVAPLSRRMV